MELIQMCWLRPALWMLVRLRKLCSLTYHSIIFRMNHWGLRANMVRKKIMLENDICFFFKWNLISYGRLGGTTGVERILFVVDFGVGETKLEGLRSAELISVERIFEFSPVELVFSVSSMGGLSSVIELFEKVKLWMTARARKGLICSDFRSYCHCHWKLQNWRDCSWW